jgi:Flp pilus assembly pilin Flp
MIQKAKNAIATRVASLRDDERGMETAQVILILVLVVGLITLVIVPIVNSLKTKGSSTLTNIGGIN